VISSEFRPDPAEFFAAPPALRRGGLLESFHVMIRPASWFVIAALALAPSAALAKSKPAADTEAPADAKSKDAGKGKDSAKAKDAKPIDAKGKDAKGKDAKGKDAKGDAKPGDAKGKDPKGKSVQVGTYGDWGAFTANAQAKGKTCYALAQPKDRAPASLKRDAAYIFISNRPGENVRNEVSIIMGFQMKDNSEAKAEIGGTAYDLISKGSNAWVKNPAEENQFIDSLKKGSKLVIKAASIKGNASTDSYSLAGLSEALARVHKECP
jgi:hypothetical protein